MAWTMTMALSIPLGVEPESVTLHSKATRIPPRAERAGHASFTFSLRVFPMRRTLQAVNVRSTPCNNRVKVSSTEVAFSIQTFGGGGGVGPALGRGLHLAVEIARRYRDGCALGGPGTARTPMRPRFVFFWLRSVCNAAKRWVRISSKLQR